VRANEGANLVKKVTETPDVSIGILAYNEETRIGATLRGLFAQDIFVQHSTEVVVIANGCTDETASKARDVILNNEALWSLRGSVRVVELEEAGKSNAWNKFVHEFSSPRATVLFFMDSDIELIAADTVNSMLRTLNANREAVVCVDRPIKDIALKSNPTFVQRLLLASTPKIDPSDPALCGQLYCVRSDALRAIKLPVEITVEDGFLRALLLTYGFTRPEDKRRIVLDLKASHKFKSVATLHETFRHEVRVVAGSIVNMLLFERFSGECKLDRSAMVLMQVWEAENPAWLRVFVKHEAEKRGWGVLPRSWWTRRWSRLGRVSFLQILGRAPAVALASVLDAAVFFTAIRYVRNGKALGYWGRV
jgi:glycosyltransferase involved in cell wall biosynthesis